MHQNQDSIVNVAELLSLHTGESEFTSVPLPPEILANQVAKHDLERVELQVIRIPDGVAAIVQPQSYTFTAECDRCLKPTTVEAKLAEVEQHYYIRSTDPEDLTEDCEFIDVKFQTINVDSLLAEGVMYAFPDKILCKPDCTGIDYQTGGKEPENKPFAGLKDLIDQG